jgi:hypothetical protein
MNKTILLIFLCIIPFSVSWAQENGRFDLSINYGLNGSFFVQSYYENQHGTTFYKKNFVGTSGEQN